MNKRTPRKHRSQRNRSPQLVLSQQQIAQEMKVNPAYQGIITYSDTPQPHTLPKNYESYAKEGYTNDTVFKCINYIITNGAAIPPVLYTDDTKKKKIEKHPLLDKFKKPNPEQSAVFFRKAALGYFLIAGNSYIYVIRGGKNAPPDELWVLQPNRVHPVPSKKRGLTGFKYDDFDDSQNPIPAENIGFLRTWNPNDVILGMSTMEVAAITIDQQTSAKRWNLALLQNSGRMPGAWSTDAILASNDRSKLEDKLKDKFAGPRNAGRYPVLDGGLKFQSMATPPHEMDWLDAIKYNAGSIANLFNIPPQLIGDTSSTTYDNMEQAKAASYTEEIFPVLDEFYDMLTMFLVPMYPDLQNAYLYYDKDSVEVVQAVIQQQKDAKAKRANDAWMRGSCTLNEAREMQDLPPIPGGDVFRFGAILVRSTEIDKYAEQSLQKPVAPPMPVPEPDLNLPTPPDENEPPTKPVSKSPKTDNQQEPPASGKKSADDVEYAQAEAPQKWVDSTVDDRLADYADRQVTHLRWVCDGDPCDECSQNCNEVVESGSPFPSGAILPLQHPRCKCDVQEIQAPQFGMMRRRGVPNAKEADITYHDALAQLDTSEELPQDATAAKGVSKMEYRRFMEETLR